MATVDSPRKDTPTSDGKATAAKSPSPTKNLSPMMQQYHRAKATAGDAILLFRMGDFYELFYDDAKLAAKLLGLSLTSRDKGENPVPMAGFPHHQLEPYLGKIVASGRRAAVCEQMEDPKAAKGIVKRDIARIVSPGTVTDEGLLDPQANNYLAAVACLPAGKGRDENQVGVAWVDVSTGRFHATATSLSELADELAQLNVAECLVPEEAAERLPAEVQAGRVTVTTRPAWAFSYDSATQTLAKQFGARSLEGFGFVSDSPTDRLALAAAGAVLDYLVETQRTSLSHIERVTPVKTSARLQIDASTWRSLEVTQTLRDGSREGSLLGVIDRTVTSLGARRLAEWLRRPLVDVSAITERHAAVEELVQHGSTTAALRETLSGIYDLERLLARVTTGRASPRDLSFIARTLALLPKIKAKLTDRQSELLTRLEAAIDLCGDVRSRLDAALVENCPLSSAEGGYIREGCSPDLDECRTLMAGGKQWMAAYQAKQVEATGIPSMKIGFNKVFGYYLEVTHAHKDKIPAEFIRKQTLKNAERYITPELKEYEEKVLSAEERCYAIEYALFVELRELTAVAAPRILATSEALADLDALASLAELAQSRRYVRPSIVDQPALEIVSGRHPVLDVTEPEGVFVPNDTQCCARPADGESDSEHGTESLLLITGPNMAGKSTYIRQNALIVLLAQIGSFVPAESATIGVADRLFARVGASDELSRGQSTFMVEMTETARILNTASRRSVVILDEIGRGTSTYDGLSLAWAIVEHLHNQIGCRTMFATHYHELTALEAELPGVANRNVAVQEHEGRVVFLHQIIPGAADRSYGIHVAQLAGVPRSVNDRAASILADLESSDKDQLHVGGEVSSASPRSLDISEPAIAAGMQLTLFETADHPMVREAAELKLDDLSPRAAWEWLYDWRERLAIGGDH